jgi:hypothetical protein
VVSENQVQEIIQRAKSDAEFSRQLFRDLPGTLKANGYSLQADEVASLRAAFSPQPRAAQATPGASSASAVDAIAETVRNQQSQSRARADAQSARLIELGNATVDIFKTTLKYSARTYRMVTLMNSVMFWMGVGLFGFAALYGAFTRNLVYTGIFCGLGAASFVSLFFLGPIDKTQAALSNLIQAEIAFMSYFEQITFAENYAMLPPPDSGRPTHESIAKASEMLQQRSKETIEILHYIRGETGQPVQEKTGAEVKPASERQGTTAAAD